MKVYCVKTRFVSSFGGRRLDTICDVYQEKSHDAFTQLDSVSMIGGPEDWLLSDLAKNVSGKYPFVEKDEIVTIEYGTQRNVDGFRGLGMSVDPFKPSELESFTRHMKSLGQNENNQN